MKVLKEIMEMMVFREEIHPSIHLAVESRVDVEEDLGKYKVIISIFKPKILLTIVEKKKKLAYEFILNVNDEIEIQPISTKIPKNYREIIKDALEKMEERGEEIIEILGNSDLLKKFHVLNIL